MDLNEFKKEIETRRHKLMEGMRFGDEYERD